MKDEILKEIAKGNVAPFARAVAILPFAGMAVRKAQNALRPNARSDDEGIADYLAAVGVMGLFSDLFRNAGRSGESFIVGPTLSDIGQGFGAIATARDRVAKGEDRPFEPLAKFGARQVPVLGPTLTGLMAKPESARDRALRDAGLYDEVKAAERERKQMRQEIRR